MPNSDREQDAPQQSTEEPHQKEAGVDEFGRPLRVYTPELPPREPRDAALGRYMDAWSRLESAIHYASQEILEIEAGSAYVIWSAIQTFQAIKVLDAAAKIRLNAAGKKRVARICEQLLRRNTRRNFIIHGTWLTSIRLSFAGNPQEYGEWRRVYTHTDPDLPASDDGSDLTVPELDKTTGHVEEMIAALWSLVDDIPTLRVQQQTRGE